MVCWTKQTERGGIMHIRQEGTAAVPENELEADFRAARDLGKVRVGERGVFLQKFSGVTFLPFGALERVWLRQEISFGTFAHCQQHDNLTLLSCESLHGYNLYEIGFRTLTV